MLRQIASISYEVSHDHGFHKTVAGVGVPMSGSARTGFAMMILLAAVSGTFAAPEAPASILGRYKAVTESEWQLELELRTQGSAIYTLSNWEPGKSATTTSRTEVKARWELKDGVLSITFAGSTPEQSVSYEVSECLSYRSFGGTKCSPGLRPISNGMGRQYSQPLWNAKAFKFP
jgi:hypothetical protein